MSQQIVVSGFLNKDGKALLVKRAETEKFLPGYWELPGGKVEHGESADEALVREFYEETGVKVIVGKPFHTYTYMKGERHTIDIIHNVTAEETTVKLSPDHEEYAWVAPDEIENYRMTDNKVRAVKEGFS